MIPRRLLTVTPALLAAVAGAAWIAYQWTWATPFWVDEEMIALNLRGRAIDNLAGPLWLGQSAPPGWLVVQRLVLAAAGTSEMALRAVPVLFGIATLGAAAWIACRWLSAMAGFVFVAACATGTWLSFFPLELKHYSADAFWGLLLPALAAWMVESDDAHPRARRYLAWWAAAALAHWLSNGGLLATPACAVAAFFLIARRHSWRDALTFAACGALWLASFATLYFVSLRYTVQSEFLWRIWSAEIPPGDATVGERVAWAVPRLGRIADTPIGSGWAPWLWLTAAAGWIAARSRVLGVLFAMMPLSSLALGALGQVPLFERFALWMVPSVYAGIALLIDRAQFEARGARASRARRIGAAALAIAALLAAGNIAVRGLDALRHRSPVSNRGLHDRDAAKWVLDQLQPGDALLTTRLGWPALWWYGNIEPTSTGTPNLLETGHRPPGDDCRPEQLESTLAPYKRAVVYLGFPDMAPGYGELLLRHLDALGAVAFYSEFGDGFAAIVDLHTPGRADDTLTLIPRRLADAPRVTGCIAIAPARLW